MEHCRICNNNNNKYYIVKELQIGYKDSFKYMECSECLCLQLIDIPEDMSKYYPKDYFSFIPDEKRKISKLNKAILKLLDNSKKYYYQKKGCLVSRLICYFLPETLPPIFPDVNVYNKKILDVGCGHGKLLKTLSASGFNNLFGVDPFIENDITYNFDNKNIYIYKNEFTNINEKFDIIMFNHSLEHIYDQDKTMEHIYSLLNDNGICIICIPTVSCYLWHKYKEYWYQLDAPRHIYLHSLESMGILCERYNFKIDKVIGDSMTGNIKSKLYLKEMNDKDQNKYLYNPFRILTLLISVLISKYYNKTGKSETIRLYLSKC